MASAGRGGRCRISIHAPPRGATSSGAHAPRPRLFQFTPLREGRRRDENAFSPPDFISIHAPPRGATEICKAGNRATDISIHAPPRGATNAFVMPIQIAPYFNSRPSARGDPEG